MALLSSVGDCRNASYNLFPVSHVCMFTCVSVHVRALGEKKGG